LKKIYQSGWDRINEMAQKRAKESQIENKLIKNIMIVIFVCCLFVIPILPIFLTEEFVSNCSLCQSFISFMSSWIPGIKVIAGATKISQIVSLEVSLAWVAIIVLSIVMLSIFFINKNFDSDIFGNGKKFVFMYIIIGLFLAIEIGLIKSNASFFYGTDGLYDEDSRRNIVNYLIQSKIGLSFYIFTTIFIKMAILVSFIMMNIGLIKKLFKGN
jgi:hypothetical protein